jgi:hypothetical protein
MRQRLLTPVVAMVAVLAITTIAFAQTAPPVVVQVAGNPPQFSPVVLANDAFSASQSSAWITSFVATMDAQFISQWGFRPTQPVTVYLYDGGDNMAIALATLTNTDLTVPQLQAVASGSLSYLVKDSRSGGFGILVNLAPGVNTSTWRDAIMATIYHDYAMVMETDMADNAGPNWYRQGLVWLIAYGYAPGDPSLSARVFAAAVANEQNTLPTLPNLNLDPMFANPIPEVEDSTRAAAIGFSYLALNLMSPLGGSQLMSVLVATQRGEDFDSALQRQTGFTVQSIDQQTRLRMPPSSAVQVATPVTLGPGATPPATAVPALLPSLSTQPLVSTTATPTP